MTDPGVLVSLVLIAVILTIGAVLWSSEWRVKVEGLAVLFGTAVLLSLAMVGVGAYWLWTEYPSRQLPGAILATGGMISFAMCTGSLVIRWTR